MFDVKHALGAAFSEAKTINEKVHLVQMLLHYTQFPSGKDTNWRTVGRETELVTKLLNELGVPAEAYDKRVSVLDSRVTDFRWTRVGTAVIKSLRDYILNKRGLVALSRVLGKLYDTSATGLSNLLPYMNDLPEGTDSAGSSDVPASPRSFIYRVEQKTAEKIKKYLDTFPTGEFSDFLRASTSAIPSLGTMEKILVDLDLMHPETRMFDVPHRPQNDHKTILRHFDDSASFPTANAFCNVITPFEYYKEQKLHDASANGTSAAPTGDMTPLHGFFYRDKEMAAKMATPRTQILMATFEEFTPGNQGTCLAKSSDLSKFWNYVGYILSTFLEDNVKILPVSRIVIRNDYEFWSRSSSTRNGAYAETMEQEGFLTPGSVAGVSLCAIVNANSSGALCDAPVRHLRFALPTEDISSVYESRWTPDRYLAAEWFSITHDNLKPISTDAGNTYTGSILMDPDTIMRHISALKSYANNLTGRASARLLSLSAVSSNSHYKYDSRRDRFLQLSALISSLCASFRTYHDPGTESEPLTFWDTTEHPDDPYAKLHDGSSMISAVYSGIPFAGSYFEKLADHLRTARSIDITEYIPKLVEHQFDIPEVVDDAFDKCGRMIVFETNMRIPSDPAVREALRRAVIRSVNTMLVARQIVASAGIVDSIDTVRPPNVYTPGEYPERVHYVANSGTTLRYAQCMDLADNHDDLASFRKWVPEGDTLNANLMQPRNRETAADCSEYLFAEDKYGRMYIVVILKGLRMRMALAQARAAAGLPLITAMQRAGFSNGVIRLNGATENDLVSNFVQRIMRDDRATDFGGLGVDDRVYGYSPMAKSGYDGLTQIPVQRNSYTGGRMGGVRVWNSGCVTGSARL